VGGCSMVAVRPILLKNSAIFGTWEAVCCRIPTTQIEGIEMMGRQEVAQAPLFYSFNLDAHIPANHLLRGIDRFLDLSELHAHLASHYSNTGRPSIDPALLIRMLVVGYCFGIRSERQLCEE